MTFGRDEDRAVASLQGSFDGLGQSRSNRRTGLEPVDHNLDIVLGLSLESQVIRNRHDLTVDPDPHESGPAELGEEVLVFPLLASNYRGEHRERRSGGQVHDSGDDLLARLSDDGSVTLRTMSLADPGEEDAKIVADLGDRPDRTSWIPTPGLLLDRDRGTQAVDPVDLGFGHLTQELAGVARQAFNVTSLSFRIESVERQAALARAGNAGKADEFAAGKIDRNVPEIVLASASDHDVRRCHPWGSPPLDRPALGAFGAE